MVVGFAALNCYQAGAAASVDGALFLDGGAGSLIQDAGDAAAVDGDPGLDSCA